MIDCCAIFLAFKSLFSQLLPFSVHSRVLILSFLQSKCKREAGRKESGGVGKRNRDRSTLQTFFLFFNF